MLKRDVPHAESYPSDDATSPLTAEQVIRARMKHYVEPDPIRDEWETIYDLADSALRKLAERDYEGGELAMVGLRTRNNGVRVTEERAVWKLTNEIYLLSDCEFGMKVVDPLFDLDYSIGVMGLDEMMHRFQATKTRNHLNALLTRMGR